MLTSIWQDRHPRTAEGEAEPVSGQYDVVVVGGGLTGLTTALLLGRAGRSVAVLEGLRVGEGTTARSTAKVSALQGTRLSQIASRHTEQAVHDYVEAQREGVAWVAEFCGAHAVPFQRRAAVTYGTDASGEEAARAEHDLAAGAGLDVEWHDELALPFRTRGGVVLPDQLQVDPLLLLDAIADQAREHGVRIFERARVTRVSSGEPYVVGTADGEVSAGRVVIATNLPILDRGGFFARMKPARSYGVAYTTPHQAVDAMYLSASQPSRSLRDGEGEDGPLLLVGGSGHTTGRSQPTSAHLQALREWTAQHWPDAREVAAWSAQDFVPHHALPFAGPVLPTSDAVLFAGGYSKWGMTNAVAASLVLSARILGGHIEWSRAFRTWGAPDLRGLTRLVQDNAEVGASMTLGWAGAVLRGSVTEDGISRVCTHMGGIVTRNDAEGSWDCPLHGSRFAPDGSVLDGPAVCGLRRV